MKERACVVCVIMLVAVAVPGVSEAAHFQETGTSVISDGDTLGFSLVGTCSWEWDGGIENLTIAPDPGESIGDEVTLSWCVTAVGEAHVAGPTYSAVGGVGSFSSYSVDCSGWSNPDPATVVLNPGPGEQTIFTYGPQEVFGGDPPISFGDCTTLTVQIGDVIQSDGVIFGLVEGPDTSAGTNVTLAYTVDIRLLSTGIPAQGRWGVILLASLIGLWTAWYLVRLRR